MSIVVNTNIASLIAQRNLSKNTNCLTSAIQKLSSGYKINSASDDAAGLSISESLSAQIKGTSQAQDNVQAGNSLLDIADSALSTINDNLQRIRELAVQAANDTNGTGEREAILLEINARLDDIDRLSNATTYNKINLLNGTKSTLCLQVGANSLFSTNVIDIASVLTNNSVTSFNLQLTGMTGQTWNSSLIRSYINTVDNALGILLNERSNIGAMQNRLSSALDNLSTLNENLQSANSAIRDVDIGEETSTYTKYSILQQASASVLSQANSLPKLALTLLQNV